MRHPLPAALSAVVLCGTVVGAASPAVAADDQSTTWSRSLPSGRYEVTVKHPDDNATPGWYHPLAEGRPLGAAVDLRWDKTYVVDVADGRLDLELRGPQHLDGLRVFTTRVGGPDPAPAPTSTPTPTPIPGSGTAAQRLWPGSPADRPLSGVRIPGTQSMSELRRWSTWRGRPAELVTTYGMQHGYQDLASNDWPVTEWSDFQGRLNYSLPLVPSDRSGSLAEVADGKHDDVWTAVAKQLRDHGRGDSVVRVGWEYNLDSSPWHTTNVDVGTWRRAYRHVVQTMRATAPGLKMEFGINCGTGLDGSTDRMAALTQGYPGDDVVDLVGCDVYDWWQTKGATDAEWQSALRPKGGPGVQDVVDFARTHGKAASFGEWGVAPRHSAGGGDDAHFVGKMHDFFVANKDVVAFEAVFEDDYHLGNAMSAGQVPQAAGAYRRLFGG